MQTWIEASMPSGALEGSGSDSPALRRPASAMEQDWTPFKDPGARGQTCWRGRRRCGGTLGPPHAQQRCWPAACRPLRWHGAPPAAAHLALPAPPPDEAAGARAGARCLCAAVALAQLLSLCLAVTGVSSATLAAHGIAIPMSQSVLNYTLLALTFGGARLAAGERLRRRWWCYAALALVDVEANFLVVKVSACLVFKFAIFGGKGGCYAALALVDAEAKLSLR